MSTQINQLFLNLTNQTLELEKILNREENQFCADCDEPHPTWVSLTWGCFICANCASAHRFLGDHISLLQSVESDTFYSEQVECLATQGNKLANSLLEYEVNSTVDIPRGAKDKWQIRKSFIKRKYEDLEFIHLEGSVSKSLHRLTLLRNSEKEKSKCETDSSPFLSLIEVKVGSIKFKENSNLKFPNNPIYVSSIIGNQEFKTAHKKLEKERYTFEEKLMYTWNGTDPLNINIFEKQKILKVSKPFVQFSMNLRFLETTSINNSTKSLFPLYNRDNKYVGSIELEFNYAPLF